MQFELVFLASRYLALECFLHASVHKTIANHVLIKASVVKIFPIQDVSAIGWKFLGLVGSSVAWDVGINLMTACFHPWEYSTCVGQCCTGELKTVEEKDTSSGLGMISDQ